MLSSRKVKSKTILAVLCLLTYLFSFQPAVFAENNQGESPSPATVRTSAKPFLIISGYETSPSDIAPGQNFSLKLKIKNTSTQTTKNILVSVGSGAAGNEGGQNASPGASGNLVVTGTGNSRYLKELKGGAEQDIEFNMVSSPKATPGLHDLNISIDYTNNSNETFSAGQQIGIKLVRKIALRFQNTDIPPSVMRGETFTFSPELINASSFKIEGVSIQLTVENASIDGEPTVYIGGLDSGDSESMELKITADNSPVIIKLIAKYIDDFNAEQTISENYSVKVETPSKNDPSASQVGLKKQKKGGILQSIVNFFKALLGL